MEHTDQYNECSNIGWKYLLKVVEHQEEDEYGPNVITRAIGIIKDAHHSIPRRGVVLAAANLCDARDARSTLAHEVLGH